MTAPSEKSASTRPNLRILLVDDHALLRLGLKTLLRDQFGPVEFGEASTYREARGLIQREPWSVILMDIALPGRDGLELLVEARKSQHRPPVVVFSMYPHGEYGVEAIKKGASAYLSKSATSAEVIHAISEALAGRRYLVPELADLLAESLVSTTRGDLSSRELQVLRLLSEGKTLGQIAQALSLSEKTVCTYKSRICSKLNVGSVAGLVRYALLRGVAN